MEHLDLLKLLNSKFSGNFYLVGGFVRDLIRGVKSEDYDIATDILPEELLDKAKKLNIKAFPTGIKHGTITLIIDNKHIEITTFREDFENNGRYSKVKFTKSIKTDASRRDFTVNAIYLDADGKFYDFYNGISDIKQGIIKFIGNPENRIQEDYLRIIRFFRFFAIIDKNNKSINTELTILFEKYAAKLEILSQERISQEFLKICSKENFHKAFLEMYKIQNLKNFFMLNEQFFILNDSNKPNLSFVENWNPFKKLCLIYFDNLSDLKNNKRFRWSNKQISQINILKNLNLKNSFRYPLNQEIALVNKDAISFKLFIQYLLNNIEELNFIQKNNKIQHLTTPVFPINGNDLINLGFKQNASLSTVKNEIKFFWITNNFPNKETCLDFSRKLLKKYI